MHGQYVASSNDVTDCLIDIFLAMTAQAQLPTSADSLSVIFLSRSTLSHSFFIFLLFTYH